VCGIYAYIGNKDIKLKEATSSIAHRGPDDEGFLVYDLVNQELSRKHEFARNDGHKIALGFRRLAIIDLNEVANQPFSDESGEYHMIFNGEIYNYLELKEELRVLGYSFRTASDTEVLLKAYIQWGNQCFEKFNGMWALCIVDLKTRKLVLSRDRFGIKPLFYHQSHEGIRFFSEIKQVFQDDVPKFIEEGPIRDFLCSAVLDASDKTFFKDVHRFPTASYTTIDFDQWQSPLSFQRFWQAEISSRTDISFEEASKEFKTLFQNSIELRFRSDVEVGACLSGGLDSSSIVSTCGWLGKTINAYNIDNQDPKLSELSYAKQVIEQYSGLQLYSERNKFEDLELLDKILWMQDEPISGLGVIAQWNVMQLAKSKGSIVLLDGQGGDELLGGYRKFIFFFLKETLKQRKLNLTIKEAFQFLTSSGLNLFDLEGVRRYLNRTNVDQFLSPALLARPRQHNIGISGASGFKTKSLEDILYYSYPQLLRYEDRNSMAFSLESRVPFLDYRLVQFVLSLPSNYLIRNGYTKAILRESMKGILPESIRARKSKLGFATPEKEWMYSTYYSHFLDYIQKMNNPYLENKQILDVFTSRSKKLDHKSMLRVYLFSRWYDRHFK